VVAASFSTFTGKLQADVLRLNLAIPASKTPNPLGVVAAMLQAFQMAAESPTMW